MHCLWFYKDFQRKAENFCLIRLLLCFKKCLKISKCAFFPLNSRSTSKSLLQTYETTPHINDRSTHMQSLHELTVDPHNVIYIQYIYLFIFIWLADPHLTYKHSVQDCIAN